MAAQKMERLEIEIVQILVDALLFDSKNRLPQL